MRYLGIDYGSRSVGVAFSDERGQFAFPLAVFPNDSALLAQLGALCTERNIEALVFGDTRAEGGGANTITAEAEQFADELSAFTKLPVSRVREAWSSFEAARFAPDQKKRDDVAAAIILQRFLDSPKKD